MAGQDTFLLTGGNTQPTLAAVASGNRGVVAGGGMQSHHSILALLVVAVVGLWALDKFGFRFAVTTGKR